MLIFKLDAFGNKIEFEPASRPIGSHRLYICECTECGKEYNFVASTLLKNRKCSCSKAAICLEYEGRLKTLEEWHGIYPTINLESAKVRLSKRKHGKRPCTDLEVLWGYGKRKSNAVEIKIEKGMNWQHVLITELNNRLSRLTFTDALFTAVAIASREPDFVCASEDESILTQEGKDYRNKYGESLLDLLGRTEDVDSVRVYLSEEENLSETTINSFFK